MFKRRNFKTLTVEQWLSFSARHPCPTFQAGPAWALALNAMHSNIIPEPIVFEVNNGATVLLPLIRSSGRLGWQTYCGFPLDGYDVMFTTEGAVVDGQLLRDSLDRLSQLNVDRLELTLWPFLSTQRPSGWAVQQFEASVIDLSAGAEAAIERMDGRSRRMAGQAQRRGVTCTQQTDSHGVDAYYDLLLQSAKRWGRAAPTVTKPFLEALLQHGGDGVEIWLATYEGKPIAGIIGLYGTMEVNVWSAAMDSEYAVLRPHNVLNVTLMTAAAAKGVRWYNLGSSEGLPGVKKFKDGLGARTISYDRLSIEKGAYKFYQRLRQPKAARGSPEL